MSHNDQKGFEYIGDSEVSYAKLPACVCIYQSGDSYHLVEVNTGRHGGSIISIPNTNFSFLSNENAANIYNGLGSLYPLLKNVVIYNNVYGRTHSKF